MQRIGQMFMQKGNLLLKTSQQKNTIKFKANEKIMKQGDTLQSFG
jgi:hypothetical protein